MMTAPFPVTKDLSPEDFLESHESLAHLVALEMELNWKTWAGAKNPGDTRRPPLVEAYLDRFPDLNDRPETVIRLVQREWDLRTKHGDRFDPLEYRRKFPDMVLGTGRGPMEPDEIVGARPPNRSPGNGGTTVVYGNPEDGPAGVVVGQDSTLPHRDRGRDAHEESWPPIEGFTFFRKLGSGSYGSVYHARDKDAIELALKVFHEPPDPDEVKWHAKVTSDGIVKIYYAALDNDPPYIGMEYVRGQPLDKILKVKRTLPPDQAARWLLQLARSIEVAHDNGIIHRDLKPGNILVAEDPGRPGDDSTPEDPRLKICDFGLAKQLDRSLASTVAGTAYYMAAEQFDGTELSRSTDIYALGAILYEMLTGRPPYIGDSWSDLRRQLEGNDLLPIRQLNRRVPKDLETICLKCLRRKPEERFRDVGELIANLRKYQKHQPLDIRPVPLWERGWKWVRRNPWPSAVFALVVVVGVASTVALREIENARSDAEKQAALGEVEREHQYEKEALEKKRKRLDASHKQFLLRLLTDLRHTPDLINAVEYKKSVWNHYGRLATAWEGLEGGERELLELFVDWAALATSYGDNAVAEQKLNQAIEILEASPSLNTADRVRLSGLLVQRGRALAHLYDQGGSSESRALFTRAIEILTSARDWESADVISARAEAHHALGESYAREDGENARNAAEAAYRIAKDLWVKEAKLRAEGSIEHLACQQNLARTLGYYGDLLLKHFDGTPGPMQNNIFECYRQALELREAVKRDAERHHSYKDQLEARFQLARGTDNMARFYLRAREPGTTEGAAESIERAITWYLKVLEIQRELVGESRVRAEFRLDLAGTGNALAELYMNTQYWQPEHDELLRGTRAAVDKLLLDSDGSDGRIQREYVTTYLNLARLGILQKDYEGTKTFIESAKRVLLELLNASREAPVRMLTPESLNELELRSDEYFQIALLCALESDSVLKGRDHATLPPEESARHSELIGLAKWGLERAEAAGFRDTRRREREKGFASLNGI